MLLGVNIDHTATLRQVRNGATYPSPVEFALLATKAGADNITIHLRQDFRHIQKEDVISLQDFKLNIEIGIDDDDILDFVIASKPVSICLVPENTRERTTSGGLDLSSPNLAKVIDKIKKKDIIVSLFIEPDEALIDEVCLLGAEKIEIYTGKYAHTGLQLAEITKTADKARSKGLMVAGGHGLNYTNVKQIADIPSITELNIGHSIVSRALMVGAYEAVREMKNLIER